MGIRKAWFILILLIIQWTLTINPVCDAAVNHDLNAIKNLFLTFERGYEGKDIEKYMTIFNDDEFEYISDMATPDDPSDDVIFSKTEDERGSALRVFSYYKNLDLEIIGQKIVINGQTASAQNQIKIVFVVFQNPDAPDSFFPEVYYAVANNTFRLRKFNGHWKIVKWQQNEWSADELAAWSEQESKNKSVDDLIQELGDPNMVKWAIALSDLRKIKKTAMNSLIKALHSPSKNLRLHALWALAGVKNEEAINELIKILRDENEDADVRIAAINVLSQCESYEVRNALLMVAKASKPKVKASALLALAQRNKREASEIYQVAMAETNNSDEIIRKAAVESMGLMVPFQGNDALEKRFGNKNESEEVRLAAVDSLKKVRSESAPYLFREALKDKNESVKIRSSAARALGEIKDEQSLDLLISIAKDKKETVELRKAAITGLGTMGKTKATKTLIDFLVSSDDNLRYEAVKSLELLADRRALKPLMMVLMNRDERDWIRRLAGRGVVKIDGNIAFGPLTQILKDKTENAPARRIAAEELVSSGNARAITIFANVLKDKQQPWWLRRIAVNCLARLESPNSPSSTCAEALKIAVSDPDVRVANAAREALATKNRLLSKNQ